MDVGTLKYNLEVNDQGTAKSISEASKAVNNLKSNFEDADKQGKVFSKSMFSMSSEAEDLSKSIGKLAVVGTAAAGALGVSMIKAAADTEQTRISFTTMLNSAEKAEVFMKDLAAFAAKTPFDLKGLENSSKQLLAYGSTQDQVLPQLKALGDIAAGVGTEKLPQLITAFGQTQAATVLMGGELKQFTEAGVPLIAGLAEHFGIAESAVKDMVSTGQVGFSDVQQVLIDLSSEGGKFNNLMDAQSKSLNGMVSNLGDAWDQFLRAQGAQLLEWAKGFVSAVTNIVQNVLPEWIEKIQKLINFFTEHKAVMAAVAGGIVGLLVPALKAFAINTALALLPLLPYAAAFAAVGAAAVLLYNNFDKITGFLQDTFPNAFAVAEGVVNDIKTSIEGIADSMKTSVEKISENSLVANNETVANLVSMSQESSKAILQMKLTGETLSSEMKDTIVNNALEMRDQVIGAIDGFAQAQVDSLQSLVESGIITNEILESASAKTIEFAETEKVAAQERVDRIREITEIFAQENAATLQNKEALTAELNRLTQEQSTAAINTTNAQVSEILGLQELLKVESGRLAAEQGADVVQEAVAKKDAVIAAAEAEYKETVATLTLQRDQIGSINQEVFEDAIKKAREKKDGQIEEATAATEGVIAQVEKMATEQGLIFDRSTNEILTEWQQFWSEVGQEIKHFFRSSVEEMHKGSRRMSEAFSDGIKDTPSKTGKWGRDVVDEATKNIRSKNGQVETAGREIERSLLKGVEGTPNKMLEIGTQIIDGLTNGLRNNAQNAINVMQNLGGQIMSSFQNKLQINSPSKVFEEYGNNTAEGFLIGVENGAPDALDAMTRFSQGLIDEAKVVEESLNFEAAFEELGKVVDSAYAEAEKAVLDFVNENLKSQESIRNEIQKTQADIDSLTLSFEKASEAARLNFEGKATDIVLGAEGKSADIQAEINKQKQEGLEIQERINIANSIGEEGAKDLKKGQEDQIKNQEKLLELQAKLAEQQAILKTAEESGVVSAAQLEEARRLASLNPLEALIEQYAAEKEARDQAFTEEQAQLEERRAALEASLQEREEEYANFMVNLLAEDQKFTLAVNTELQKREKSTTDSINRLIIMYNKLANAKKSAGRQEGGMAEGSNVQFSEGGKTGIGHDNEVAGDVHKNEFVVPAWMTRGMPNMIKHLEGVRTKQIPMGETINNNQKNVTVNQVVNNDVDAVAAFYRLKWIM